MFNIFKKDKLPKSARKSLAPSADFLARNKTVFLSAFRGKFAPLPAASHFGFAAKAFASAFAVFIAMGGAAVYADTANVGADSPLYPLKRLHESVQLVLASHDDKAQLQVTLAERRTQEIKEIEEKNPQSPILPSLANDLHNAIDGSIGAAEKNDLQDGKLVDFCDKLLAAASTSSLAAIREEMLSHPRVFARFDDKCGKVEANNEGSGDSDNEATTTVSAAATSSAPEAAASVKNESREGQKPAPAIHGDEVKKSDEGITVNIKKSLRKNNAQKYRELNLDFQNRLNAAAAVSSTESGKGGESRNSTGSRPGLNLRNFLRRTMEAKPTSTDNGSSEHKDSLNATVLYPDNGEAINGEKFLEQPSVPATGEGIAASATVSSSLKIGISPKGDE